MRFVLAGAPSSPSPSTQVWHWWLMHDFNIREIFSKTKRNIEPGGKAKERQKENNERRTNEITIILMIVKGHVHQLKQPTYGHVNCFKIK